jgi:putative ABC transport system permease protein
LGSGVKGAEAFRVALDALSANRLRSVLTMLGVIIGVAAVVVLVAIGTGAKNEVETQVEGLGSNLILVVPGRLDSASGPSVSRLQLDDVETLSRVVGDPQRVTTTVTSAETVTSGARESFVTVQGTTQTYPEVFDRPLTRGRYLSAADVDTRRRIAVLGSQVAQDVFPGVDPLGRQVTLAGVRFRVVGVFAETGAAFGFSRDIEVHVPVTAAQRLLGVDRIDGLAVKAPSTEGIEDLQARLVDALQEEYPGDEFSAVTQTQILGTIGRILNLLTLVLAAIAGRRRFQHHAGERARANPRDRSAQGAGSPATRHPAAVPHRSRATHDHRRRPRDRARRRGLAAHRRAVTAAGRDLVVVPAARVRRVRVGGRVLRCRAGASSRPPRPRRGPAYRMTRFVPYPRYPS